jgi:glycosyltransferase involved in cell wall biosynthesis
LKRIVIPVLFYHPDRPSGADRLGYEEAEYLARLGHDVWVVAQDPTGRQPEYAFRDRLHVLHYSSPRVGSFSAKRVGIHQQLVRGLLKKYVPEKVDLVHGQTLLGYHAALSLYGDGARTCYSVHSPVKLEMLAESRGSALRHRVKQFITAEVTHWIERRCLVRSTVITSDSSFTRRVIGRLHKPSLAEKTQVVPGWVEMSRFRIAPDRPAIKRKLGWSNKVPVFFTLRRLVPRNGIDNLLKALRKVRDIGYDFQMMIGSTGSMKEKLEKLNRELGLEDRVHFLGRVPEENISLMYAAADAFLLPTAELECFGLIMLEAFASGRPVLATPVGAIPEIVAQVEPRWLARDSSVNSIAELIAKYLAWQLPEHAAQDLRNFVAEKYSSEKVIPRLVNAALGKD